MRKTKLKTYLSKLEKSYVSKYAQNVTGLYLKQGKEYYYTNNAVYIHSDNFNPFKESTVHYCKDDMETETTYFITPESINRVISDDSINKIGEILKIDKDFLKALNVFTDRNDITEILSTGLKTIHQSKTGEKIYSMNYHEKTGLDNSIELEIFTKFLRIIKPLTMDIYSKQIRGTFEHGKYCIALKAK